MNFLKNFVIALILCFILLMCVSGLLFDPPKLIAVTVVAFAFLIAAALSVVAERDKKIRQLEEKIKNLEGKA